MALRYREHFATSVDIDLLFLFRKLADDTRINKSRLIDEAIKDLLIKHGVNVAEEIKAIRKSKKEI